MKKIKSYILDHWILATLFVLSLLCYLCVLIPPTFFWPAIYASYAIPGLLILNLLVLIVVTIYKITLAIFPLLSLLFGAIFMLITFSNKGGKTFDNGDISVLSYNVRLFRESGSYDGFSEELIKWVSNDSSEIKCIQEYCSNSFNPTWDSDKLNEKQGYASFIFTAQGTDSDHDQGLAIFSKYDILDTGFVWTNYGSTNGGIFADIKVGKDTMRVYNVHLESMGLVLSQYKSSNKYDSKIKRLLYKLKKGAEKRSEQIEKLVEHCGNSPYPYIICGDFNDTPYSYNYFKLKRYFSNAFEDAGNGFGFSFNSILFFLRIDHQFYDSKIEAVDYRVDRSIKISDHFPTRGFYKL